MLFVDRLIQGDSMAYMWVLAVVFSVCCHEYAHAQMALWQGRQHRG